MRAEAKPFVEHYGLVKQEGFFAPLPCMLYSGKVEDAELFVVLNGEQHGADLIGCEPAAITTMAAIQQLRPDIVISSGTCGGWQRYGMEVGRVYIANGAMFHDRRVPGDNEWHTQGIGNYSVWEGAAELATRLDMPMAKVTTGSSFDMTAEEETIIDEHGGRLKEMEGAAVAFTCSLFRVPVMLVKAVTNLRDAEDEDIEAFQRNLATASENIRDANIRIIQELVKAPKAGSLTEQCVSAQQAHGQQGK